jgi:mono/diheme cytochrome c family protein
LTRSFKIAISVLAIMLIPATSWSMPWSWDFFTQPSHKAQEEKALAMPLGTVPVKGSPVAIASMADAADVKSPVRATKESIERGRDRFKIYCAVCHGNTGKGDGIVGKKYVPPTDLTSVYVQNKEPGQIYYAITYGGLGIMPKYADSMSPEDRWHIANYILNEIKNEKE